MMGWKDDAQRERGSRGECTAGLHCTCTSTSIIICGTAVPVQASPLRPILSWTTLFQLRVCACQVVMSQSVLVLGVSDVDLGGAQKTRQVVIKQSPHSARLVLNRQQTKRTCAYTVSDLLVRYVPVSYLQPASHRFADTCVASLARYVAPCRAMSRQVAPCERRCVKDRRSPASSG